jgi:hypothetical protein
MNAASPHGQSVFGRFAAFSLAFGVVFGFGFHIACRFAPDAATVFGASVRGVRECHARTLDPTTSMSLIVAICQGTTVDVVYDYLYKDDATMTADFESRLGPLELSGETGGCNKGSSVGYVHWFHADQPDVTLGKLLCWTDSSGGAEFAWTVDGKHIQGAASRLDGNRDELYNWWKSNA